MNYRAAINMNHHENPHMIAAAYPPMAFWRWCGLRAYLCPCPCTGHVQDLD